MALVFVLLAGHLLLIAFALLFLSRPPMIRTRRWPDLDPRFLFSCLPLVALFLGILLLHLTEVAFDLEITAALGVDYTQAIHRFEGDFVAVFQSVTHPILDLLFTGIYVYTYPFLIYFTAAFFVLHRDRTNLAMYTIAFFVGYLLALPFFLFLPMSDPWSASLEPYYAGRTVEFRLQTLWPDFLDSYYKFTSPNNELPSLHSQLSAMCAGVAWLAGYRRYAIFATFCAVTIPISSMYMGVHWITDIAVAQLFAAVSVLCGLAARRYFASERGERVAHPSNVDAPPAGAPDAIGLDAAE